MAGSSLLTLLDDIATLLDDIAVLTKTSASKTAGVLGDDLALNAQQVTGVRADRELPVVWAVAKGAMLNKLILIPAAMLISAFAPWALVPLLIVGGCFLCFEGFEKLVHGFENKKGDPEAKALARMELAKSRQDPAKFERDKVKGAIRTDFILSAEIIAITLGTVAGTPLLTQFIVLSCIGVGVTVLVYGIVAGIVRLDDLGLYLQRQTSPLKQRIGEMTLAFCPKLMWSLSFIGTAAMFLVGGGIIVHGVPAVHHWVEHLASITPYVGWSIPHIMAPSIGMLVGAVLVCVFEFGHKIFQNSAKKDSANVTD